MSIQSRDCDYCVRATVWRAADPVPLKCQHCGAPPKPSKPQDQLSMFGAQLQAQQMMGAFGMQALNNNPYSNAYAQQSPFMNAMLNGLIR